MPVRVWKHVRRNVWLSRTSRPVLADGGTEREVGVRDLVIAWTLWLVSLGAWDVKKGSRWRGGGLPMKCAGENEVVVHG